MTEKRILILGGTGLLGSRLVPLLARMQGNRITVVTRDISKAVDYRNMSNVGVVAADVHREDVLDMLIRNTEIVINLVGTRHSRRARRSKSYGVDFDRTHVQLPEKIVGVCMRHGGRRYIHVSALGVTEANATELIQSKAAGEERAFSQPGNRVTVLRPAVIYGEGDHFLSLLAALHRQLPIVPLTDAQVQFQPVFADDVVAAIIHSLQNDATIGKILPLAGPQIYTLGQLVDLAGHCIGSKKSVFEWPRRLAGWQRLLLPKEAMTQGNLVLLQFANNTIDPIAAEGFAADCGVTLTPLETVVSGYLNKQFQVAEAT